MAEPHCRMTWIEPLRHAPFPYHGTVRGSNGIESDVPFFDRTDPVTGQSWHTVAENVAYPENPHYTDNRVLFHVPPQFNPNQPFELVLFLHGHGTEIKRTLIDQFQLPRQINQSGRNAILIAPQLAREARDSSPGKLSQPNGMKKLLDESATILSQRLGFKKNKARDAHFRSAPIILVAYSGGYRTLAHGLERGGVASRIRGVILLDALYSDRDQYVDWLTQPKRRAFFINLHSISSRPLSLELMEMIVQRQVKVSTDLPKKVRRGAVHVVPVATAHELVPVIGPPTSPIAELLRRIAF